MKYEVEPGTGNYRIGVVTFFAKKGKSIDLDKIHADIKATRLSGKTRSRIQYFEITAEGDVATTEKETVLRVSGTPQQFVLGDDPSPKPKEGAKTAWQRLQEALAKGEKVVSVTGRVHGWSGPWPEVLRAMPGQPAQSTQQPDKPGGKKPPLLLVTDFRTAEK